MEVSFDFIKPFSNILTGKLSLENEFAASNGGHGKLTYYMFPLASC
jgi:hypothetical protein